MTQRLKTVFFALDSKTSDSTNNTDTTALATTSIVLEAGTKTFVSVSAEVSYDDFITATGGTTTRRQFTLDFSPGGGAAYVVNNTASIFHSGENLSFLHTFDFTAAFQTEMGSSGTSTVQWKLLVNQTTGTTTGVRNTCVVLKCTYWYDDTEATQVKTVFFPLATEVGALPTSVGSSLCTIPDFLTDLPENGVTLINRAVIVEGNESRGGSSTDFFLTAAFTLIASPFTVTPMNTGMHEGVLRTDRFFRHVFNYTLSGAHAFRLFCSASGRMHHPQVWGWVTYSFTVSGTTRLRESAILPSTKPGTLGASAFVMTTQAELSIPAANVSSGNIGLLLSYTRTGSTISIVTKIGSGSTTTFSQSTPGVVAGGDALMDRNDAGITLTQGINTLSATIDTGASDFGYLGISAFWIVNYDCDVPAGGIGASSRSLCFQLETLGAVATHPEHVQSAAIPSDMYDAPYYLSNQGVRVEFWTPYPGANVSIALGTDAEICADISGQGSGELGRYIFVQDIGVMLSGRSPFCRWLDDVNGFSGLSSNPTFLWRFLGTALGGSRGEYLNTAIWLTLHECPDFPVAGDVINSNGGTVTMRLHDATTGAFLVEQTRSGDGAFSFNWFDARDVYVDFYEDNTYLTRSATFPAGTP